MGVGVGVATAVGLGVRVTTGVGVGVRVATGVGVGVGTRVAGVNGVGDGLETSVGTGVRVGVCSVLPQAKPTTVRMRIKESVDRRVTASFSLRGTGQIATNTLRKPMEDYQVPVLRATGAFSLRGSFG